MVYKMIDVDIELDDFSDDEILAEAVSRNLEVAPSIGDDVQAMWQAFYIGNDAEAMRLARQIAETATGRMVPTTSRSNSCALTPQ